MFLFEFKEDDNFSHPGTICLTCRAGRNTLSISRINPPKIGGGLKFESVGTQFRSRASGAQKSDKKGNFAKVSKYGF